MKLTYEQHQELLELANYLAKARRITMKQGIRMDDLITAGIEQPGKQHVQLVEIEKKLSSELAKIV